MGYSTDFSGSFKLSRPATQEEIDYINTFSGTRRMKRDTNKLMELFNGKHGLPYRLELTYLQKKQIEALEKSGLVITYKSDGDYRSPQQIYGKEGEFFALDDNQAGQTRDTSIIDYNTPPGQTFGNEYNFRVNNDRIKNLQCQPSLWCQWILTDDGEELEWDGGEKFYCYTSWLEYMIFNFFEPWGIKLNGEVRWVGEDSSDMGLIQVEDNIIQVKKAKITYE